jgi:hypothetical protein
MYLIEFTYRNQYGNLKKKFFYLEAENVMKARILAGMLILDFSESRILSIVYEELPKSLPE